MRQAQVFAVVLAIASWAALLSGLWFAPPAADPVVDLEGGGGFAAGFGVYLPAIFLSLVFVVVLLLGARNPRSVAPLVVSLAVGGFAAYVLQQDYLLDYLPTLAFHLWLSVALAVTSAGIAAIAACTAPSPEPVED